MEQFIEMINELIEKIAAEFENIKEHKECYLRLKNYDKKIIDHIQHIKFDPKNRDSYLSRSFSYYLQKNYEDDAEDNFNKIDELHPENLRIDLIQIPLSYLREDYDKILKIISQRNEMFREKPNAFQEFYNIPSNIINYLRIEKEQEKDQARVDERNKVIADLSHSIKNLVKTVIDPLENLKQETVVKPQVIENALKGANLIREIVNAMNLSFRGSIDDFYYDAEHNTGKERLNLQSAILESLRYSAGNMFDGKYFGKFQKKYFPTKDIYLTAKSEWANASQSDDSEMYLFLEKHFFKTDIFFGDAKTFIVGNDKGSAVKFLVLFQEIILNAVKYVAFVEKEKRFLRIRFTSDANQISVRTENPFKPNVKAKTTGIGHVIIENFAKLLNAESPIVTKYENLYSVEIRFPNFWEERKGQ